MLGEKNQLRQQKNTFISFQHLALYQAKYKPSKALYFQFPTIRTFFSASIFHSVKENTNCFLTTRLSRWHEDNYRHLHRYRQFSIQKNIRRGIGSIRFSVHENQWKVIFFNQDHCSFQKDYKDAKQCRCRILAIFRICQWERTFEIMNLHRDTENQTNNKLFVMVFEEHEVCI